MVYYAVAEHSLGVMGASQVDSTTTLVAMLDEATALHGCVFNNAVMRKALKSLVNQDVQLSDWARLTDTTKKQIDSLFVMDESDGVSSDDFYVMMITQVFTKLFKIASMKIKSKEQLLLLITIAIMEKCSTDSFKCFMLLS